MYLILFCSTMRSPVIPFATGTRIPAGPAFSPLKAVTKSVGSQFKGEKVCGNTNINNYQESSSALDQCKLVTAHECLGKCSWTGERLMQRNTHHSNACMRPQLEAWGRLGNSSTKDSKILLLKEEGKNEEKGCPGPQYKRKSRLHSVSGDGKLEATMILWVLWEKQGWTGNTRTHRTPISSHIHIATPRRDLWSLACCIYL